MRYQRTAQRITSAVNCRPLKLKSARTSASRRFAMPELGRDPARLQKTQQILFQRVSL
jgi:hypothetical protein